MRWCRRNSRPAGSSPLLPGREAAATAPKDVGQRTACSCIPSKDIGAYDSCPHFCVYCYANRSEQAVRANLQRCRRQPMHGSVCCPRRHAPRGAGGIHLPSTSFMAYLFSIN